MKYRKAIFIGLCVIALIYEVLGVPGSAGGAKSASSGGKSTSPKGNASSKNNAKQPVGTNAGASKVNKASSGSILSAWGIISLIIFIIGSSAFIYYVSVFYPLVCAKRGKYDVMEMTSV